MADLDPTDQRVLDVLSTDRSSRLAAVARLAGVEVDTAYGALTRLRQAGLVRAVKYGKWTRAELVDAGDTLTEEGQG